LPEHPLMSVYAQCLMSAIGVLAPIAAVSLLPSGIFQPPGRSATIAAILVVAAAWAFYGAAIGVPVYFVAGALATVSLELGLKANMLLSIPMIIGIIGLTLFFWLRITLSVLELNGAKVLGISIAAIIGVAVVAGRICRLGLALSLIRVH